MNKIKEIAIVLAVLAAIVLFNGVCFGVQPQPQIRYKPKNLRDFLPQVPNSVYNEYGWGEETFLLYNLISVKMRCDEQQLRIEALEKQVAELDIDFATKVIQEEYNSQHLNTAWFGNPVVFDPYVTDKNNVYLFDRLVGFRDDGVVVWMYSDPNVNGITIIAPTTKEDFKKRFPVEPNIPGDQFMTHNQHQKLDHNKRIKLYGADPFTLSGNKFVDPNEVAE